MFGVDRIAARTGPLACHGVGGGVDFGDRDLEDGGIDVAESESEFACGTGNASFDGGHDLGGFGVNPTDGAVALVEGPGGAGTGGGTAGSFQG